MKQLVTKTTIASCDFYTPTRTGLEDKGHLMTLSAQFSRKFAPVNKTSYLLQVKQSQTR